MGFLQSELLISDIQLVGLAILFLLALIGVGARALCGLKMQVSIRGSLGKSAAAGLILYLFFSGLLLSIHQFGKWFLFSFLCVGVLLFVWELLPRLKTLLSWRHLSRWTVYSIIFLTALFVLKVMGAAVFPQLNFDDDLLAYIYFPVKMLEAGSLIEPYNLRRIASYGGESSILAMFMNFFPDRAPFVFSLGVAPVILCYLIVECGFEMKLPLTLTLIVSGLVALDFLPRINLAPGESTVILVLFIYLMSLVPLDGTSSKKAVVWLGAALGALVSLRANHAAFLGVVFLLPIIWQLPKDKYITNVFAIGMATVLFLMPWAIHLFESSGTLFYPLMQGNVVTNPQAFSNAVPFASLAHIELLTNTFRASRLDLILLAVAVSFFIPTFLNRGELVISIASMVFGFLCIESMRDFNSFNLSRYIRPVSDAAMILIVLRCSFHCWNWLQSRKVVSNGLILVSIVVLIGWAAPISVSLLPNMDSTLYLAAQFGQESEKFPRQRLNADIDSYRKLQDSVPPKAKLLVMVDRPYLFDFKRNEILTLDWPGEVVPNRDRINTLSGLNQHMKSQNIDYLAFVDPIHSLRLYSQEFWMSDIIKHDLTLGIMAPKMLNFFDLLKQWSERHQLIATEFHMLLVKR